MQFHSLSEQLTRISQCLLNKIIISVVGNYSTKVLVSRAGSVVTNFMAQRLLSTVDLGACIEYNTDYTGHDIRDGAVPGVDNFKDCQNLCFLRPDCNFW